MYSTAFSKNIWVKHYKNKKTVQNTWVKYYLYHEELIFTEVR